MEKTDRVYGQGLNMVATLMVVALIVSIIFGIYNVINKNSLIAQKANMEKSLADIQSEITDLEDKDLPQLVSSNELSKRMSGEIKWSKVVERIATITPETVFYRSYSASSNGQIVLAALAKNIEDLTQLIDSMTDKAYLSDVFVPTVTKGTSSDGQKQYSFSLQLDYDEIAQ